MVGIYGNGVALSEKVLDYLWGRQSVSLYNIANVDTPGFKSQYITFEEEMSRRLSAASNRSMTGGTASSASPSWTQRGPLYGPRTWSAVSSLPPPACPARSRNGRLCKSGLHFEGGRKNMKTDLIFK